MQQELAVQLGHPSSFAEYSRSCASCHTVPPKFPPHTGWPAYLAAPLPSGHGYPYGSKGSCTPLCSPVSECTLYLQMISYVPSGTLVVDLYTLFTLPNYSNKNIVTLDHPRARRKDMLPTISVFFFA